MCGADHAPPFPAGGGARHLCRRIDTGHDRLSRTPRRHGDRVHAGPGLRPGPSSRRARPVELLGIQHPLASSRPSRAISTATGLEDIAHRGRSPACRPASRSSSTSSTTIPAKAIISARHCRWRGIDNASYYRLLPDDPRYYDNCTGCGNAMNTDHPRVLQMVMDSLRYWATVYGIDGFRFDLATTLGRRADGFDPAPRLLQRDPAGSGARPNQAHRRALGHRPGRLPARRVPAGLGRNGTAIIATRVREFWRRR